MKQLTLGVFIALITLPFVAIAANSTSVAKVSGPQYKHVFKVKGLMCDRCVIKIKKVFMQRKGVQSVDASLKNKKVTIYTKKDVCFSTKELKRLFEKQGFTYYGTTEQPKACSRRE